jgi:hypothetical protein
MFALATYVPWSIMCSHVLKTCSLKMFLKSTSLLVYVVTSAQRALPFYFAHLSNSKVLVATRHKSEHAWTFLAPFYQTMMNPGIHKNVSNMPLPLNFWLCKHMTHNLLVFDFLNTLKIKKKRTMIFVKESMSDYYFLMHNSLLAKP